MTSTTGSGIPEAYIYDAVRTPRGKGKPGGSLHTVKPVSLLTGLIEAIIERNPGIDPERIGDIITGCVTPVGDQGMDIARTAALSAGLPFSTTGVQINRYCASGLTALNLAAGKIRSGWDDLVIAGGVESMSRVPMSSDGGAIAMDPETSFSADFIPRASPPTSSPRSTGSPARSSTPSPPAPTSAPPPPGRTSASTAPSSPSGT